MKTFEEIFTDKTKYGVKVQTSEYGKRGKYIIIDQGQSQIAGYTDREEGVFEELPVIVFGDHTRTIKYVDKPFFLGADGVKVLRSKDSNANYKYLYYALKSAKIPDTGYNRHFKWLKKIQINYPDNNRQEEIVQILDKVSDIIKNRESELSALDELIKARFVEMFGDPVANPKGLIKKTLPELGEFGRGVSKHRPRNDEALLGGPYPLIQTGDVANSGLYITEYHSTYSELGLQQSKMWDEGTLCITIAANIAKTAILGFDACFQIALLVLLQMKIPIMCLFIIGFSFFQEILESQAPESAQKNINLKILSELKVIVPNIQEQNEFADFVVQVEKTKDTIQKSLDETQILFDSLMQKYFG